ncbi:MAG: hypothetical protein HY049_01385 [Acidobacteria bacterium]|nr:hypothetical protein [Acidobacteriota bacterium]
MKKAWLLFAVLVVSAAALTLALAQSPAGDSASTPAPAPPSTLSGATIVTVSPTSIAVKTDPGGQISLVTDTGTVMPAEPKVGDGVDVEYEMSPSGRMRAVRVTGTAGGGTVPPSQSATTSPQDTAPPPQSEDGRQANSQTRQMPKTASLLPLAALFGVLSITASLALRASSRSRRRLTSIGRIDA